MAKYAIFSQYFEELKIFFKECLMSRFLNFTFLAIIVISVIGCASRNTLEIVNQSDYEITVNKNGKPLEWKFKDEGGKRVSNRLRPGESGVVGVSHDSVFVAKAWSGREFVGTATFRKEGTLDDNRYYGGYYSNYSRRAYPEAWILEGRDFDSRGGRGIFGSRPVIDMRGIFR